MTPTNIDLIYEARGLAGLGGDKSYDKLLYALSDAVERLEEQAQSQKEWIDRVAEFSTDAASAADKAERECDGLREQHAAVIQERDELILAADHWRRFCMDVETRERELKEQLEAAQRGGVGLIAAERQRQMDAEGWTPEHDDRHDDGALARAACVYATDPDVRAEIMLTPDGEANVNVPGSGYEPRHWPWEGGWKPTPDDRVRELVKAGALIAAEIDRLQRASFPAISPEACRYCAGKGGRHRAVASRFLGTETQVHDGPWETCSFCGGSGVAADDAPAKRPA